MACSQSGSKSLIYKRLLKYLTAFILLGSLTIQADPFKTWNWDEPVTYTNGNPIPGTDNLTYTLHCNDTSGETGEPYEIDIALDDPGAPPSIEDMAPVIRGRAGTYHCVSTATSSAFGTTSGYSNETPLVVTQTDLGFVPNPPQNLHHQ